MNKKKLAIIKLSVISVVIALLLIFSFIAFDGYAGFYNAVQKGLELNEGIYATYDVSKADGVTDEDFAEDFNTTYLKIKSLIEQKNYQGAVVYKTSDGSIRIETPDVDNAQALLAEIGSGEFKIRLSSDSKDEVKISGADVKFAVATTSSSGYWGTYIQFTEETAAVLSNLTKEASSSKAYLYFYRGNAENYFFYLPVSSQITNDFLFVSSSTGSMTQDDATKLAISISCGSMPAVVKIEGEVKSISALDGAVLGLSIAMGIATLLILIIFAVLYRELGLMACLSILFYIGTILFLIQAIPVVAVTSASLGAILLGLILIIAFNLIILEKIKSEYVIGKKLNIAIKTGYKKSINVIVDISGTLALTTLVMFLICTDIIKSFSLILLIGSLVACFSSLFLTYHLVDSYSAFNKNNGKKVNFTREENANEIE